MAILGGSPLGLIGVQSTPTRDGMSTFNGGSSRNINVFDYNQGRDEELDNGTESLFSTRGIVKPWSNIGKEGSDKDTTGLSNDYKGINRNRLHSNEIYDTSILNIIEKLSGTPASLRPQDFAYCRNVGVYPNNRLMIARRFPGPVGDNIYRKYKKGGLQRPLATLISWKKEDEDFIDFSFGEEWIESKGDFTDILNELGEDFKGKGLGDKTGGGLGVVPLPGFTEQLQRKFLENLGVFKENSGNSRLPAGDPNLIKESKRRKTITYGEAGSGLKCDIKIKMVCEYEQKFISGIDPTVVWQDLLYTILRFGSSTKSDYGLSPEFGKKLNEWSSDPSKMISDFAANMKAALTTVINNLLDLFENPQGSGTTQGDTTSGEQTEQDKNDLKKNFLNSIRDNIIGDEGVLTATFGKYKEAIKGVIASLSGIPSTPWHITIGNPMRPIFCSGDMLTTDVQVNMGADLGFNDLPSRITVTFTLENARPLGIQEIFSKFNTGHLRSINPASDWSSVRAGELTGSNNYKEQEQGNNSNGESTNSNTSVGNNNTRNKTTENAVTEKINPDATSNNSTI
jgi:hypothetical protein